MYRTPLTHMHAKPNPTGNTLVRLADITLEARLDAIHHMMKHRQLTDDEAVVILDLCIDPGDCSCRIAA
jgi:hypothetical protein